MHLVCQGFRVQTEARVVCIIHQNISFDLNNYGYYFYLADIIEEIYSQDNDKINKDKPLDSPKNYYIKLHLQLFVWFDVEC